MVLGPQMARKNRQHAIDMAEVMIDQRIEAAISCYVDINADKLDINREEWDTFLKSKYLHAGWTSAEWISDRDGSWIALR